MNSKRSNISVGIHKLSKTKIRKISKSDKYHDDDGLIQRVVHERRWFNEAIRDIRGALFPFGCAKLLWRLKVRGVKQARIPLMGLRKNYHNARTGLSIVAKLCETVFEGFVSRPAQSLIKLIVCMKNDCKAEPRR